VRYYGADVADDNDNADDLNAVINQQGDRISQALSVTLPYYIHYTDQSH